MRLRRLLVWIAGAVAVTAAVNRGLRARAGPLEPSLPGTERTYRWRGFDIRYAEAGDPADRTVVLLHGLHAAASAREFEGIFDRLAEDHHVLAVDLPGFGRSARPKIVYEAALYMGFIRDFVADETDSPVVIASSLTGALTAAAVGELSIEELVLVNPTASTGSRNAAVRDLMRSPVLGSALFNLVVSRPSLRYYNLKEAYTDPEAVTQAVIDHQWRTAHQPQARFAPASFIGGYLDPDIDLETTLADLDCPITLVWGRESPRPPLSDGRRLAEAADTRLVVVGDSKLLPHDQHPEAFIEGLSGTLERLEA